MQKIVIIGAGASGLMTALTTKTKFNEVILLERNSEVGKKILATGNGRCNYWNADQSLTNYHSTNKNFLSEIITESNCQEVQNIFTKLGIIPKIKSGYYYPSSNQATSIRNALLTECLENGVVIKTNTYVTNIEKKNNLFIIETQTETFKADILVITTGAKASPKTGSDGNGYLLAKKFNHTIINPLPALVQLKTTGDFLKSWSGVRTDVKVFSREDNNIIGMEEGEIQLTDYGVSGICIFNLSSNIARGLSQNKKEELIINFLPFIESSAKEWLEEREKYITKTTISNQLESILNYKLVQVILNKSKINKTAYYEDLTETEKTTLLKNLTNFTITIIGTNSFDNAQVTSGGIPLTEINVETMESKLIKNLYFAGEILDVDGKCGGYNLGFAWLTGLIIGKSIGDNNVKNS